MNIRNAKPEERPALHDVEGYVEVLLDERSVAATSPEILGRVVLEILHSYGAVVVSWRRGKE